MRSISISARRLSCWCILLGGLLLPGRAGGLGAETFRFGYRAGESYRILSTIRQEVRVDRAFHHRADQLNRLLVHVKQVDGDRAFHVLEYQNSVESRNADEVFAWDRNYLSEFWRDRQGSYRIGREYFVPTVLDVPWFPDQDLQPGETWVHDGVEIHDLRAGFEIPEPFRFTMPVSYEYVGPVSEGGKTFQQLRVSYKINFQPPPDQGGLVDIARIAGYSRQVHWWDSQKGRSDHYEEEYSISLVLATGETWVFSGTADGRVIDNSGYDAGAALKDIQQDLDKLDLEDVSLRKTDEGITIALEDIRFQANSPQLLPGELAKLEQIAAILARYPDRDLLVTGHTALAGTPGGRQTLSVERARVVAQYLLEQGVRTRDQIMYDGKGADEPIADNGTPEGMARNRRVEITILDK